ncbi:nuclear receptor-binding protein isoform X3 [Daphnia magna]|uniref:Nuclear receptor-binding protein homolog n=2 Tax=Daphnia magna TaxID=35525 RepID=A0A162TAP3_9CRUS|nr:nuclear receptor-binding protein isoform X3 [Daphnia magna]XP_032792803.1 nuclear receptor-binding protein isoform X3 [Daphnia magna]XP_032792807.1 nuclear receptor-binding protein isoform X3 [Daphnia magna]KZS22044.1 Nuclear receptor-binding protein [Daphnia magna]
MAGSLEEEQKKLKSGTEDSEDESEILEESPCGRWLKRREVVQQRDVPGIDAAYLAMDTEEGVEVVWNEVRFSERKNFKAQEEKISQVFDNLIKLEHPNIVKFHKYWIDSRDDKPRVIFITEYMSSGSLKQFLKRTKRNVKKPPLQAWKRWCTQILSALSFLHSCSPPIVHGNLTCDTIFIQHNGLIKIGSVAPDAIHQHVKTCREGMKNTHFIAPEFGIAGMTPAVDIYSFGMCALEMATLEIQGANGETSLVTEDQVQRTIEGLEVPIQSDFIRACLKTEPELRPTARGLLFHRALFEVSPLKLLAAHTVVRCSVNTFCKANISETICDKVVQRHFGPGIIVAEVNFTISPPVQFTMADIPVAEKLEKFVEDVKYGIYPLTVFAPVPAEACGQRPVSPDTSVSTAAETPEPVDVEARRVSNMICDVKPKDDGAGYQMTLLLRMDDKMNRQLSSTIMKSDHALALAEELVHYGFINEVDRELVGASMNEALRNCLARNEDIPSVSGQMNLLDDYGGSFNQILSTTSHTASVLHNSPPCSSPVPSPASPVHAS